MCENVKWVFQWLIVVSINEKLQHDSAVSSLIHLINCILGSQNEVVSNTGYILVVSLESLVDVECEMKLCGRKRPWCS